MTFYSAHLGYLFNELKLIDRVAAASDCGFDAVEHPNPFSIAPSQWRELLDAHGLEFVQHAAAVGDAARGEKGLACLVGRQEEFRRDFDKALDFAVAVGSRFIHPMSGVSDASADKDEIWETYRENISHAIGRARGSGVRILIEAISEPTVPGYLISTLDAAAAVQDEFGADNVAILVDTFHAAVNGVDLAAWLLANANRTGHVHIADHPGRHEPGNGTLDFQKIFRSLASIGYDGAFGFEYEPSGETQASAAFLEFFKRDWAETRG